MTLARFDLHLHTEYSPDSDTPLSVIEAHCLARGLTGIAVTDNDTIEGALRLRDQVKTLRIIIAEEITTRDGDVIGLFLTERIPPGMSALETMQAIHSQGGLVYLPHPFNKARARKGGGASFADVMPAVDIVEAFNGKIARPVYNEMAATLASRYQKVAAGGSDAHSLHAIGTVFNQFPLPDTFPSSSEFLTGLAQAQIIGKRRSPLGGLLLYGRSRVRTALRGLRHKK